jgi:hypothetical protein
MMAEMWEEGKLLLLPTAQVKQVPAVHFSPMSWAPKADKKEGRPIGDLSSPRGAAVNCDAAADLVRGAWGPIELPTLQDIVGMILQAADEHGWSEIELWKMDLKGAFTLINFRPEDAKWLAFELTDGMTAVHIVGTDVWMVRLPVWFRGVFAPSHCPRKPSFGSQWPHVCGRCLHGGPTRGGCAGPNNCKRTYRAGHEAGLSFPQKDRVRAKA